MIASADPFDYSAFSACADAIHAALRGDEASADALVDDLPNLIRAWQAHRRPAPAKPVRVSPFRVLEGGRPPA
jgi:hypothetical protein